MKLTRLFLAAIVTVSTSAITAHAQENTPPKETEAARDTQKKDADEAKNPQKKDDTLDRAGDIVSQPARDIGVVRTEIPPLLLSVVEDPYSVKDVKTCRNLSGSIKDLNAVLGQDFAVGRETNESRVGKFAEAGGKAIINSLIPFRGLVREVTGAGPAERRRDAAIAAGFARRGFLRGLYQSRGCKTPLN